MEGTKQNNGGNKTEKFRKLNRRTEGIKRTMEGIKQRKRGNETE